MTTKLTKHLPSKNATPQTSPVRGKKMVANNAGGYTFEVDKWGRLQRFLILGTEGGTYYVSEKDMTVQNYDVLLSCLGEDYKRTIDAIVNVSVNGRAPKNDPAVFALAVAASFENEDGTPHDEARAYALANLNNVCRIPTHLFQFCETVDQFRGWGSGLRKAIARWYLSRKPDKLAYQVAKYQQRGGWSHRDVLRLSHIGSLETGLPITKAHDDIFRYIQSGDLESFGDRTVARGKGAKAPKWVYPASGKNIPDIIPGMVNLHAEVNALETFNKKAEKLVIEAITEYGLTHEMIPTQARKSAAVWEALLQDMPLTAMIRNLGQMTSVGLIKDLSDSVKLVKTKLADEAYIKESRVHPITILTALRTYDQGHAVRGNASWKPVSAVSTALDKAFYLAFGNIIPTGKKIVYALDVSGSMEKRVNDGVLRHCEITAALSMALARVEEEYVINGFAEIFKNLGITPKMSLNNAVQRVVDNNFGSTDCSLPAKWALKNKINVDAFVVMTDNETWSGNKHPFQALKAYRDWSGIPTRQVVLATAATPFTIADPSDTLSMDIAGFDTSVPNVINEFIRGEF